MANKVSIVTVSFNCVSSIEDTILSVVNQKYKEKEFVIIDGGSTDGTLDVIKKYDKQINYWVSEKDAGIYDAMNKGIKASNGDWIIFMNSGDCFYNLNVLTDIFSERFYSESIFYGDRISLFSFGKYYHKPAVLSVFRYDFPIFHQSTFCRLYLLKNRLFDTQYKICSDFESLYYFFNAGYSFRYLSLPISICECEDGLSSRFSSQFRRIRENTRITNVPKCSLSFVKQYFRTTIRVALLIFLKMLGRKCYSSFYQYICKNNSRVYRLE